MSGKKLWNENLIIVQPQRFTHRIEMRKRSEAEAEAGKTFPIFSSIFNATLRFRVNFFDLGLLSSLSLS